MDLKGIVLTYPGSKFSADACLESFSQHAQLEIFWNNPPKQELYSLRQLTAHLFFAKMSQIEIAANRGAWFSFEKQSVLKLALALPLTIFKLVLPRYREAVGLGVWKTLNVRTAYERIWERAVGLGTDWVILLEDDAELKHHGRGELDQLKQIVEIAREQGVFSIELSDSYSLNELDLEGRVSGELSLGASKLSLLSIGATNTACAAMFHVDAIKDVLRDSLENRNFGGKYVPIDNFVAISLSKNGRKSALVSPGIVDHKSDFRSRARW